jgi:hypothetical protein
MDRATSLVHFVNVIETDLNQVLGSYLQFLSLAAHPAPWTYHLVIVDRSPAVTAHFLHWAEALGMSCRARPAASAVTPYMNRWLFLEAFPELLAAEHVAFVDWDVIYVGPDTAPQAPAGQVLCRRNPPGMYRHLIRRLPPGIPDALLSRELDLFSSVNAGVVIGSGEILAECAARNRHWVQFVFEGLSAGHLTDKDQLAFSIAVGEVGWSRLADPWNVTPLSPVADGDVQLWHYNNSVQAMMRLKRELLQPASVAAICQEFAAAWPRAMRTFLALYEAARPKRPFHAFLH